ncbi:MAG: N-acetylmuramoyl-L-alanine amidase [Candidatus Stahlbacteria bacterium]|nr:N-acetylmuramoyl-L-alanine amidase [Candidatus Stahlbacteria bacterium]
MGIILIILTLAMGLEYNNKVYQVETKMINKSRDLKFTYFSAKDLQSVIGFEMEEKPLTQRIILKYKTKEISLYPDNPWSEIGEEVVNLPIPPVREKNKVWLPLPLVSEIVDYFVEMQVKIEEVRPQNKRLIISETKRRIKKIVIDAGHGGKDPGAVGPNRVQEKDITLGIAKLTAIALEERLGIECILTRQTDIFVPLGRRARIANQSKSDLFISIHCNADPKRQRQGEGTEIYFLSPAKTNWSRAVEARENASLEYETKEERSEVETILWDLAQTEFLIESNTLSGEMVNCVSNALGSYNRGVKQANFYVLRGVYMPTCLLEVEFISNAKWEKKLQTQDIQLLISEGIVEGVRKFKTWYER